MPEIIYHILQFSLVSLRILDWIPLLEKVLKWISSVISDFPHSENCPKSIPIHIYVSLWRHIWRCNNCRISSSTFQVWDSTPISIHGLLFYHTIGILVWIVPFLCCIFSPAQTSYSMEDLKKLIKVLISLGIKNCNDSI